MGFVENVNNVATNATNINNVSDISGEIEVVANIAADVSTVATLDSSDLEVVADNVDSISTVSGNIGSVIGVADNEENINAIVSNISNITTVAGNTDNINSAVNNANNINAVVANELNINKVANVEDEVNVVSLNIADIETVANNIDAINDVGSVGITAFAVKQTQVIAVESNTITLTVPVDNLSNIVIDLFINGIKINKNEFTTTGDSTITLIGFNVIPDDIVDVSAEVEFDVADTYTKDELDAKVDNMKVVDGVLILPDFLHEDLTIEAGTNGMSIGSLEIADGKSITVANGSVYKVI